MALNLVRYEVNSFRHRSTVVGFASRSRVYARKGGDSSGRPVFARFPDWPEMAIWVEFLQKGDCFVDVGANIGLYSLLALELGCSVVAVEPAPDMAEAFRRNMRLNAVDAAAITLLEIAALDREEQVGLVGADANRRAVQIGAGTVAAARLDSLVGERSVRGMKIDVEGYERQVIEGAAVLLGDACLELIQLEWNSSSEMNVGEGRGRVAGLLRRSGFELIRPRTGMTSILYPRDSVPEYGTDVFAARGSALVLLLDPSRRW